MMFHRTLLALALLVAVSGCDKGRRVGHFGDNAFYHVRDHYRARYVPGLEEERALLPSAWQIDNYHTSEGRPTRARRARRFFTRYDLDANGDGRHERVRTELVDLRYVHRRDGSVIWARTLPMSAQMRGRDLSVILRDYIDRSSGGTYVGAMLFSAPMVRERRLSPRILNEGPATVDGGAAYAATVEFLDVDRHRVDPDARGEFVTLAITRPGDHQWRSRVSSGSRWPMLLLFGYSARPEVHASHEADFESFVSRIDIAPRP